MLGVFHVVGQERDDYTLGRPVMSKKNTRKNALVPYLVKVVSGLMKPVKHVLVLGIVLKTQLVKQNQLYVTFVIV